MYSKTRVTHPRIFTDVLQAISDLRDVKGSTVKTIVDQLQTNIKANQLPKPRNMVVQVKRALRHGLDSGVLRMAAGKYKLSFVQDAPNVNEDKEIKKPVLDVLASKRKTGKKCGKCIPPKPRKFITPNRRRRRQTVKRKPCRRSASLSTETQHGHTSRSSSKSSDLHSSVVTLHGREKRKVVNSSKYKKIEKPRFKHKKHKVEKREKLRKPKDLPRSKSDEPTDPVVTNYCSHDTNKNEKSKECEQESRKEENREQQEDLVSYMDYNQDSGAPECDNPECLCHLKQEPDDDY